jgi:hypothetical protein
MAKADFTVFTDFITAFFGHSSPATVEAQPVPVRDRRQAKMCLAGRQPLRARRTRSLLPLRNGLNGSFIKRILQLIYHFVNGYFKEFLKTFILDANSPAA